MTKRKMNGEANLPAFFFFSSYFFGKQKRTRIDIGGETKPAGNQKTKRHTAAQLLMGG